MSVVDMGSFDPSASTGANISNSLPGGAGTIVFQNDSGVSIQVIWGSNKKRISAQTVDYIQVDSSSQQLRWVQDAILGNSGSVPLSRVAMDGFSADEPFNSRSYPMSVPRTTNTGNTVSTTNSNSLIVVGETAPNDIVKTSPASPYAGATLELKDDGTVLVSGFHNGTQQTFFSITPGTAGGPATMTILASILASLTMTGAATASQFFGTKALGGANQTYLDINPSDGDHWGFFETTAKAITLYNTTTGNQPITANRDGSITFNAVTAASMASSGAVSGTTGTFSGAVSAASYGAVSATTGTFSGAVSASTETAAQFFANKSLSGSNQVFLDIAPGDGDHVGLFQTTGHAITLFDFTTSKTSLQCNSDGSQTMNGVLNLQNGGALQACKTFSGSSSGTFAHGLSVAPGFVGITVNQLNTTGTVGVDTLGSTNVHVNLFNTGAWVGLAVKS